MAVLPFSKKVKEVCHPSPDLVRWQLLGCGQHGPASHDLTLGASPGAHPAEEAWGCVSGRALTTPRKQADSPVHNSCDLSARLWGRHLAQWACKEVLLLPSPAVVNWPLYSSSHHLCGRSVGQRMLPFHREVCCSGAVSLGHLAPSCQLYQPM